MYSDNHSFMGCFSYVAWGIKTYGDTVMQTPDGLTRMRIAAGYSKPELSAACLKWVAKDNHITPLDLDEAESEIRMLNPGQWMTVKYVCERRIEQFIRDAEGGVGNEG
jgi:hypothetical protein